MAKVKLTKEEKDAIAAAAVAEFEENYEARLDEVFRYATVTKEQRDFYTGTDSKGRPGVRKEDWTRSAFATRDRFSSAERSRKWTLAPIRMIQTH